MESFELRIFEKRGDGEWRSRETRFWYYSRGEERLAGHLFLSVLALIEARRDEGDDYQAVEYDKGPVALVETGKPVEDGISFCVAEVLDDESTMGEIRLFSEEIKQAAGMGEAHFQSEGARLAGLAFSRAVRARLMPPADEPAGRTNIPASPRV